MIKIEVKGFKEASEFLEKYQSNVGAFSNDYAKALTEKGEKIARRHVGTTEKGDITPTITSTVNGTHGEISTDNAGTWYEFGTGVYYNGSGSVHPKAFEVTGTAIGGYGHHQGLHDSWTFKSRVDGQKHRTHGIKARMFLYKAMKHLQLNKWKIARKVGEKYGYKKSDI